MKIEIDDRTVDQILTNAVKEEIGFLARVLLRDKEVRFRLWCWLLQAMPKRGIEAAGVDDADVVLRLIAYFEQTGVSLPSGGGGGADPGDGDEGGSGGGSGEPVTAGSCKGPSAG